MNAIAMIIEGLVAILLALTIGYCMLLNRRLKRLRSDEQSLRATISELVTATEIAERAVGGLKLTVQECELDLGARLSSAERFLADLDRGLAAGHDVLGRLTQIAAAAGAGVGAGAIAGQRSNAPHEPRADAQAVAAAAQAFAERLRLRAHGLAA